MAKKKKKMTPAQAAAARHEETPQTVARAQAKERTKLIKEGAQAAQRKASKGVGFRMIMPFFVVAVIVVMALAFTIGPGILMGR